MFYFDLSAFEIVEIDNDDVIRQFSVETTSPRGVEPIHFYEDGALWRWAAGGHRHHIEDCSEEEGRNKLLKWAVDDARDRSPSILLYATRAEALEEIKAHINDDGMWDLDDPRDVESIQKLNAVLEGS